MDQYVKAMVEASGHTEDDALMILTRLDAMGWTLVTKAWLKRVQGYALDKLAEDTHELQTRAHNFGMEPSTDEKLPAFGQPSRHE